jgi:hypothetical protein
LHTPEAQVLPVVQVLCEHWPRVPLLHVPAPIEEQSELW